MNAAPVPRPRGPALRRAAALAAVAAVATLALLHVDEVADAVRELAGAQVAWAVASVAANVASSTVRGAAWAVLVRRAVTVPPPVPWVVSAFLIGQLGNLLAPARLGEAAKVALLARRVPAPG
ncbi:MAG: lysylphosphatidylglycerol synthase domain-containing protein, partial [Actinomycetota bacterium]